MTSPIYLKMSFSYNQFSVYDLSVSATCGLEQKEAHYNQGFARQFSNVTFVTLAQFGEAASTVYLEKYSGDESYVRVIAVPFYAPTGRVLIDGPEEVGIGRGITVAPGHYRLVCAQKVAQPAEYQDEEDIIAIDLYFENLGEPLEKSEILVQDAALKPSYPWQENAEAFKF